MQAVCQVVEAIEAGNKPAAPSLEVETTSQVIYHAERAIVGGQRVGFVAADVGKCRGQFRNGGANVPLAVGGV